MCGLARKKEKKKAQNKLLVQRKELEVCVRV